MNTLPALNAAQGSALPVIFMALMGLSLLIYVVLDGYDLGVGMLSAAVRGGIVTG